MFDVDGDGTKDLVVGQFNGGKMRMYKGVASAAGRGSFAAGEWLMADGKVLPYLDVPFQHASQRILKLMKRPADAEDNLVRIRRWRELCPDITLRSTFIVGFPGETDTEFEALLDFLREARLDRVGCFAYSPVDGASANDLDGALPDEVREDRRNIAVGHGIGPGQHQRRCGHARAHRGPHAKRRLRRARHGSARAARGAAARGAGRLSRRRKRQPGHWVFRCISRAMHRHMTRE
jgi:hypothetical protein